VRARSFWVESPGLGAIRSHDLPPPGPGEVLIEADYSGISRGTESLVFRGGVPLELAETMRCPFQVGDLPGPVKYGYMSVGRIVAGDGPIGQAVFCLHPHQDRYVVPSAMTTPIPDGVPPGRAVLAANLETALNGIWDAAPGPGDDITVIGGGVVGCLSGWLAAGIPGCRVQLVDIDPKRAEIAAALGMAFSLPDEARGEQDLILHASGAPAGLRTALGLAGVEATIIELSWYGDREVSLPLGGAFHPRRLQIRGSQVGRIPPGRAPRWDFQRRMGVVMRLLTAPVLDVLINAEGAFEALPQTMSDLGGALCHRVVYPRP
jgi:threonine dehydrogenase-like Zn-dependent dehydrogenase